MQRQDCLDNLLNGIYDKTTVRVKKIHYKGQEKKTEVVIFERGWKDKCSYTSKKADNYRKLFRMTFCKPDVLFLNDAENERPDFSQEVTILNAINYFREHKVEIADSLYLEVGKKIMGEVVFKAINEYIIPVIFKPECSKTDDVELQFERAIDKIRGLFAGLELGYTLHDEVTASAFSRIYDSDFSEAVYNKAKHLYAIPINTFQADLQIMNFWAVPHMVVRVKDAQIAVQTYEELVDGYLHYPFDENQMYVDPSGNHLRNSVKNTGNFHAFPISNKELYKIYIPRNIYYISYIPEDEKERAELYPDITTHYELENRMKIKVLRDMRAAFQTEIEKYYLSVCSSIEDILDRLSYGRLGTFIAKKPCELNSCKLVLKRFNIKVEELYECLSAEFDSENDFVVQIWNLLEDAIYDFTSQLESTGEGLASEMQQYLDPDALSQHCQKIKEFLESEQLKKNIETREKAQKSCPERFDFKVDQETHTFAKNFDPKLYHKNVYKWLRDTLNVYYNYLTNKEN